MIARTIHLTDRPRVPLSFITLDICHRFEMPCPGERWMRRQVPGGDFIENLEDKMQTPESLARRSLITLRLG